MATEIIATFLLSGIGDPGVVHRGIKNPYQRQPLTSSRFGAAARIGRSRDKPGQFELKGV